jgi:hypothetical protein
VFHELLVESGPPPPVPARLSGVVIAGRSLADFDAPNGDELGFRRMREDFHAATVEGDYDLFRSLDTSSLDRFRNPGTNSLVGGLVPIAPALRSRGTARGRVDGQIRESDARGAPATLFRTGERGQVRLVDVVQPVRPQQ